MLKHFQGGVRQSKAATDSNQFMKSSVARTISTIRRRKDVTGGLGRLWSNMEILLQNATQVTLPMQHQRVYLRKHQVLTPNNTTSG